MHLRAHFGTREGMALVRLCLTDRRIVLGESRLSGVLIRAVGTAFVSFQVLSLAEMVPGTACWLVALAGGLAVVTRFTRTAPILAGYSLSSIAGLYSAQRWARTARPYADCIAAASGRAVEE